VASVAYVLGVLGVIPANLFDFLPLNLPSKLPGTFQLNDSYEQLFISGTCGNSNIYRTSHATTTTMLMMMMMMIMNAELLVREAHEK